MSKVYRGGFREGDQVEFLGVEGKVADGEHLNIHPMHVPVVLDGQITIHHLHYDDLTSPEPEPEVARIGASDYSGVWQPTGDKFEVMFQMHDPAGTFYLRERE